MKNKLLHYPMYIGRCAFYFCLFQTMLFNTVLAYEKSEEYTKCVNAERYATSTNDSPMTTVSEATASKAVYDFVITTGLDLILTKSVEDRTLSGKIMETSGDPLPGANIVVKGTSIGTITDQNGYFTLSVPANASTLAVSFVGYQYKEVTIGESDEIDIFLTEDVNSLSEVVVIGYGEIEKEDATGAISSVQRKDFNVGVISSPEQLLQGRTAGVQVTSDGGEPGGAINVRIRGTSSVRSGNGPLYVVNGVPLSGAPISPTGANAGSNDNGQGNTSPRNPLNFLNPDDIESIDILKDASATAIFGSRGSNGVVLITTRKGEPGIENLTYSSSFSISTITKKLDLLDREEFLSGAEALGAEVSNIDFGADTDWQDVVLRTALSQSHNLSYGTGTQQSDFLLSLGYTDQEGIVEKSGLTRISGNINTSHKLLDDRINIQSFVAVANILDENPQISNDAGFTGDLLSGAWRANPTRPIYNPDGTLAQPDETERNPAAILAFSRDETNTLRTLASIGVDVKIIEPLKYRLNVGIDRTNSERRSALSPQLNIPRIFNSGRADLGEVFSSSMLLEHLLTFDKEFNSGNKLNAVAGYSFQNFRVRTRSLTLDNFQTDDLDVMLNNLESADFSDLSERAGAGSSSMLDELQSFFGRVNYSLSEKYIFTATLRADGSSRFGADNRYGLFPSVALAWRLSEEDFIPEVFDNLKFRIGWGITGNQEFPGGNQVARQRFDPTNQLVNAAFNNPSLKWESTTQLNLGFDYAFLQGRLRGILDVYNKLTNDLLFRTESAQPATQPFVWENLDGEVLNQGIELGLDGDIIVEGTLKWSALFNISFNRNEVSGIGRTINTGAISGQGLTGAFAQVITDNQPLYTYFVRDFQGFDENGLNIFSGDGQAVLTGKSPLPDYTFGLTNNLKYKNFSLSVFFTGQVGGYVYNNNANALFIAGSLAAAKNVTSDIVGNGESRFNNNDPSTRFLEDASFMRLQNMTLTYQFDTDNIKYLSNLQLSLIGQNLFTITGYSGQDPEVNVDRNINGVPSFGVDYSAYPRARTFTLGLTASFN